MKKLVTVIAVSLSLALGIGLGAGSQALGAPNSGGSSSLASDPPLDLELRAAPAGDVMKLIGEVRGKRVEVDACVKTKIDVKLKNVPASVVESALAHKLDLSLNERDGVTVVGCAARPTGG